MQTRPFPNSFFFSVRYTVSLTHTVMLNTSSAKRTRDFTSWKRHQSEIITAVASPRVGRKPKLRWILATNFDWHNIHFQIYCVHAPIRSVHRIQYEFLEIRSYKLTNWIEFTVMLAGVVGLLGWFVTCLLEIDWNKKYSSGHLGLL